MHTLVIDPPVIAHRGASAYAPENTLASFLRAKKMGANWVEFDVCMAKCGEIVVIHDDTLERTTNGIGRVEDFTYQELQQLDAGSWFSPEFSTEKIPTLRDVIELLNKHDLGANIEIKWYAGQEEILVKKVFDIVKNHWRFGTQKPIFSSFSLTILECIRRYDAQCLLGYLMHQWNPDWEKHCDELRCVSVNINQEILDPDKIKKIKMSDYLLIPYTVNDVAQAQALFDLGVDAIFSDCPDKMREAYPV